MIIINRLSTFLKEVRLEMKKVNWLNREEVVRHTLLVLAISLLVAAFLYGLDVGLSFLRGTFILK